SAGRMRRQIEPAASAQKPAARVKVKPAPEPLEPFSLERHLAMLLAAFVLLVPVLLWAYWPTLRWMEEQWRNEPDYSHGYLVLPLAALIAYSRADLFPGIRSRISWAGAWLLFAALAVRLVGRLGYMDFMDG